MRFFILNHNINVTCTAHNSCSDTYRIHSHHWFSVMFSISELPLHVSVVAIPRTIMAEIESEDIGSHDFVVIREIYENNSSEECFENELEGALEAGVKVIVIEPTKLGEETARWINVGNCLHKTAVLTGAGCLLTALNWPENALVFGPLCATSAICAGVYALSWQFDPCCKYQIESKPEKIRKRLSYVRELNSSSPVVLVRRDDTRRKLLHNMLALMAIGVTSWRIYDWYFK